MAAKGPDGRKYLDAFQNILLSLKPHQREQWRRIVAKHVLTEKHEQVVTSRKTIKTGGKAAARETDKESPSLRRRDSGQQQNVSAREEISETFDRREVDYETAEPPGTIIVYPNKRFLFLVLGNGKAIALGEDQGLVKTIFDAKTGRLIEEDKLRFAPIKVGATDLDGRVQILEGIKAGDRVVVFGSFHTVGPALSCV